MFASIDKCWNSENVLPQCCVCVMKMEIFSDGVCSVYRCELLQLSVSICLFSWRPGGPIYALFAAFFVGQTLCSMMPHNGITAVLFLGMASPWHCLLGRFATMPCAWCLGMSTIAYVAALSPPLWVPELALPPFLATMTALTLFLATAAVSHCCVPLAIATAPGLVAIMVMLQGTLPS